MLWHTIYIINNTAIIYYEPNSMLWLHFLLNGFIVPFNADYSTTKIKKKKKLFSILIDTVMQWVEWRPPQIHVHVLTPRIYEYYLVWKKGSLQM